jgi:hypothetical protein
MYPSMSIVPSMFIVHPADPSFPDTELGEGLIDILLR